MIVSGGENVFPREVEDLLADHEAIEEAAVVGVPDEEFGQRLKAFVVLREGAKLSEEAVKDYVKANLARYKVPREVVFLDELPRNATGKVLKRGELERPRGLVARPASLAFGMPAGHARFRPRRPAPELRRGPAAGARRADRAAAAGRRALRRSRCRRARRACPSSSTSRA